MLKINTNKCVERFTLKAFPPLFNTTKFTAKESSFVRMSTYRDYRVTVVLELYVY